MSSTKIISAKHSVGQAAIRDRHTIVEPVDLSSWYDLLDHKHNQLTDRINQQMQESFKKFTAIRHKANYWVTHLGSARLPEHHENYMLAKATGYYLARYGRIGGITGAGPGIMEAIPAGIVQAGFDIYFGFGIRLANEGVNGIFKRHPTHFYVFDNFAPRKIDLTFWSRAFVLHMGGYGTDDEDGELRALVQTEEINPFPLVYMDVPAGNFWTLSRQRSALLHSLGMISEDDMNIYNLVHTPEEAFRIIHNFNANFITSYRDNGDHILTFMRPLDPRTIDTVNERFQINSRTKVEIGFSFRSDMGYPLVISGHVNWWKQYQIILLVNELTKK